MVKKVKKELKEVIEEAKEEGVEVEVVNEKSEPTQVFEAPRKRN